ncbi:MAG: hypothetical protein N2037_09755 [Acidimicrobiales bacterium]|nr:hypothetical protein [Acidimicrobiales bacterium]
MTPEETARQTAEAISSLPANFMLDAATYSKGSELGFNGIDFYVCGRGGALGDVDADVVASAFVFFHPAMIRASWEAGEKVMSRREVALAFAGCAHDWARIHLKDGPDYERLADIAGRVITDCNPAVAPMFAAWRAVPEPDPHRVKALALHRLNVLRELRGGLHGAAVLALGLRPVEALLIKTPMMAPLFGWTDATCDTEALAARRDEADALTDQMMARAFEPLTHAEREEFVSLCQAALAAVE